jgi:AraC family transcriptional regulator of arabinose operon
MLICRSAYEAMDRRVERLKCVIDVMIRENRRVSLQTFASSVNLSPSRVRHLFKAETGVSPSRYVRIRKMHEAKLLLETTFLTVKEIGNRVGLSDGSHFVRDFKRIYGSPPARYRTAVNRRANGPIVAAER